MQADFYIFAIHKWKKKKNSRKRRSSTAAIITDTFLHVSNHRRARNSLNFPLFENAARQRRVKAARTNAPSNFDWNISMSQLVDWVLVQRSRRGGGVYQVCKVLLIIFGKVIHQSTGNDWMDAALIIGCAG
jgi:hypothetical protein